MIMVIPNFLKMCWILLAQPYLCHIGGYFSTTIGDHSGTQGDSTISAPRSHHQVMKTLTATRAETRAERSAKTGRWGVDR